MSFIRGIGAVVDEVLQRNIGIRFRYAAIDHTRGNDVIHCKGGRKQFPILIFDFLHTDIADRDAVACGTLADHQLQNDFFCDKSALRHGKRLRKSLCFRVQTLSVQCGISLFRIAVVVADFKILFFFRLHVRAYAIAFACLRHSACADKQF